MVKGLFILLIIVVVPVFFVLMWVVGAYNRLVRLRAEAIAAGTEGVRHVVNQLIVDGQ